MRKFTNIDIQGGKVKISLFVFLLVVFLCNPRFSCAQEYKTLPFKAAFKWAPFGLFDLFSGPNMKVGIDFRLKNNVYAGLDGGAILFPYPLKNNSGAFARAEIKFFSIDQSAYMSGSFYYWGIEAMYKYQQFDRTDSIAIPGIPNYIKDYTMYKNSVTLHVKAGGILYFLPMQKKIPAAGDFPRFFLEFFAGAGIRQTTPYCGGLSPKEADNRKMTDPGHLHVIFNTRNGFYVWPSFELSMKFGWRMK